MSKHKKKPIKPEPSWFGPGILKNAAQKIKHRNKRNACSAKGLGYDQSTGKCSGSL